MFNQIQTFYDEDGVKREGEYLRPTRDSLPYVSVIFMLGMLWRQCLIDGFQELSSYQ